MIDPIQILTGDCREVLKTLPGQSVQTCVTSPPYWGLRDYGTGKWEGGDSVCSHAVRIDPKISSSTLGGAKDSTGHQREGFKSFCPRCGAIRVDAQIGLEPTPRSYVETMRQVFAEVWRVLKDDGTLWLNLGDTYARDPKKGDRADYLGIHKNISDSGCHRASQMRTLGALKPKNLVGIPWMVAFALQADGWCLRQDIIWHKPSVMPESVTDRCTKAHEYIFLMAKAGDHYHFDNEAIKEPSDYPDDDRKGRSYDHHKSAPTAERNGVRPGNYLDSGRSSYPTRNKRSVWSVTNAGYHDAHFATFPPDLIKPCILAAARPGDTVLDPFGGSGTTGMVALELGRRAILVELNPDYVKLCEERCNVTQGLPLAV